MNAMTNQLAVVRNALAEEKARSRSLVRVEESEFLPAALEIIERPVSPTARATSWLLLGGTVLTIAWLTLGKVDVIASAPGKLAPIGSVKMVQAPAGGIVQEILVTDGQRVEKGQPLVLLDPTSAAATAEQARKAWETAALDVARLRAVVSAIDGRGVAFAAPAGVSPALANIQYRLAVAQAAEINATSSAHSSEMRAASAAQSQARTEAQKLSETVPLLNQQLAANEKLAEQGYVSKLKVIEMRRQVLAAQRDRDIALSSASRANAQLSTVGSNSSMSRAQMRARLLSDLVRAEADLALRREDLVKAGQQTDFSKLTAPVTGTVAQLAVHTVGGVLEPAKPVMVIVPDGDKLIADVSIMNRDMGHIRKNQKVEVKLEAFPFTEYGTIPGKIVQISSDAVDDQKMGPVYRAKVALDRGWIMRGGEKVRLTPGLSAVADIRTGERRLIEYLVSPIDAATKEAARER
jgi:hemolysin D